MKHFFRVDLRLLSDRTPDRLTLRVERIPALVVLYLFAAIAATTSANAQADSYLPDAPDITASGLQNTAGKPPQSPATGTVKIYGTVLDISGAAIPGATVTLVHLPELTEEILTSDASGNFSYSGLPAGNFRVSVTAKGFETVITNELRLKAGEQHEVQLARMPVGVADTEINVVVTEQELAREQIKQQEKQRVFGILPNFYTSFLWKAASLRAKQKYDLALHSALDPLVFASAALTAGIELASNRYPSYGDDAAAYGKYYGAVLADHFVARMLRNAVLPSLFHQDPRYFFKGHGTVGARLSYAIEQGFLCRGDNGKTQFNYSFILGDFMAAGLSNVYRPAADRRISLTIENAFIIMAGHTVNEVAREFLFSRATTHLPKVHRGQPSP
jgi:hypothetical protein